MAGNGRQRDKEARVKVFEASKFNSEARTTTPKNRNANKDFRNIIPQQNQREISFNLKESSKLPPAIPMSKKSAEMRINKKYYEYHRDTRHSIANYGNLAKVVS